MHQTGNKEGKYLCLEPCAEDEKREIIEKWKTDKEFKQYLARTSYCRAFRYHQGSTGRDGSLRSTC
jgi:hypothetical protein